MITIIPSSQHHQLSGSLLNHRDCTEIRELKLRISTSIGSQTTSTAEDDHDDSPDMPHAADIINCTSLAFLLFLMISAF